jgi:hypothetical protein
MKILLYQLMKMEILVLKEDNSQMKENLEKILNILDEVKSSIEKLKEILKSCNKYEHITVYADDENQSHYYIDTLSGRRFENKEKLDAYLNIFSV